MYSARKFGGSYPDKVRNHIVEKVHRLNSKAPRPDNSKKLCDSLAEINSQMKRQYDFSQEQNTERVHVTIYISTTHHKTHLGRSKSTAKSNFESKLCNCCIASSKKNRQISVVPLLFNLCFPDSNYMFYKSYLHHTLSNDQFVRVRLCAYTRKATCHTRFSHTISYSSLAILRSCNRTTFFLERALRRQNLKNSFLTSLVSQSRYRF